LELALFKKQQTVLSQGIEYLNYHPHLMSDIKCHGEHWSCNRQCLCRYTSLHFRLEA
jgi:hypothetical protein